MILNQSISQQVNGGRAGPTVSPGLLSDSLEDHPFFADMQSAHLDVIVACGTRVQFEAGAPLFAQGTVADRFYLLQSGTVALGISVPGRGSITVQTIGPGEVVGWSWLFAPYRWSFDARCQEAVTAYSFDGFCLRARCQADMALGYELMKRFAEVVVQRLDATRMQMLDFYGQPDVQVAAGHAQSRRGGSK